MSTQLMLPIGKPWHPRAYQTRSMQFLLQHDQSALFLDPGLGKTAVTLGVLKILKQKKLFQRALIIAPLRVCHNVWPNELRDWKDFHGLSYVVLHGRNKEQALAQEVDLYIINPEGLSWLIDPKIELTKMGKKKVTVDIKKFVELGFDILVVDELSKFKHISSQRFKMIRPLLPTFARRWGLTGSPAGNSLLDLFGQVYVLDNGKTFGRYFSRYRQQYFVTTDFQQRQWEALPGAKEEIFRKLAPIALRMSAEEYGNLPEKIEQVITVQLPPAVRQIYDRLEQRFFAMIDKKPITAANAAVASSKCHQVANGGVFIDHEVLDIGIKPTRQTKEFVQLHYTKMDVVEDLIDELQGQPLLIAYDFKHDLARFQERFGKDVPYIGGGVPQKRVEQLLRAWNAGELPLLLGHPQSLGHGVNIQFGGAHVCWHSLTWNYELRDQFNRRVYRQGQHRTVFVYYIVTERTVDELIMSVNELKRSNQQSLFDALTIYRDTKST